MWFIISISNQDEVQLYIMTEMHWAKNNYNCIKWTTSACPEQVPYVFYYRWIALSEMAHHYIHVILFLIINNMSV